MAKGMVRVPVREQDPKVRATNFEEVCLGYNQEEAMEEATRCLNCKKCKMYRRMSGIDQYSGICSGSKGRKYRGSIQDHRTVFRTSGNLWTCLPAGVSV